jgi:GNAT superfamily N-acetyltransferase
MDLTYRTATPADAQSISRLVQASFLEFVAPDWEAHAVEKFLKESSPTELAAFLERADFSAVAMAENEPVGFILLAPPNLLKALFVHRSWHKRGIARQLWALARDYLGSRKPSVETIELNASPFAVEAYKMLGFYPISGPILRQGCRSTRMACWLPAGAPPHH